jgi:hypothetical protein
MPTRSATPEETEALFGNGLVIFGQKPSASSKANSAPTASSFAEETEEDGIRAEALRRAQVRRMLPAQPDPTGDSSK